MARTDFEARRVSGILSGGSRAAATPIPVGISTNVPFPKGPVQFVANRGRKYEMVEEAKLLLANVKGPLVVVAIVGKYRSGKSFLLNALSNLIGSDGFKTSPAEGGCTRGIWGWRMPEMINGRTVLLLDTEGLFDTDQDEEDIVSLFTLALLSSSLLIYNTQGGAIGSEQLMNLAYVAKVSENIDKSNESALKTLFPSLLWLHRDSTLDVQADYLEKILATSPNVGKKQDVQLNKMKDVIKRFFPSRQFMAMDRPTSNDALKNPKREDLCEDFVKKIEEIKKMIFANVPIKEVCTQGGSVRKQLDGPGLFAYMESIMKALNASELVSMSSTWTAVLRSEMQRILDAALELYERTMTEAVPRLPVSESELLQIHEEAKKTAGQKLRSSDPELRDEFLAKFEDAVGGQGKSTVQRGLLLRFVRLNEEISQRVCDNVIATEKAALEAFAQKASTTPASFTAEVKATLARHPRLLKGPKAEAALQALKNFCMEKERVLVSKANEAALEAACKVLRGLVANDAFVEVKAFEDRKATEASALRGALVGDQVTVVLAKFEEHCVDMRKNVVSKVEARKKREEQARQQAELQAKLQAEQKERERVAKLAEAERRAKAESEARLRAEEERRREEERRNRELQQKMAEAKAAEERARREAEARRAEMERREQEMREEKRRMEEERRREEREREERRRADEREREARMTAERELAMMAAMRERQMMAAMRYEPSYGSPYMGSPSYSGSSDGGRFYRGGQFIPGGGRAPRGGCWM